MAEKKPLCQYDGAIKELQAGDTIATGASSGTNFSYNVIDSEVTVPAGQQMLVYRDLQINSTLNNYGQVVLLWQS